MRQDYARCADHIPEIFRAVAYDYPESLALYYFYEHGTEGTWPRMSDDVIEELRYDERCAVTTRRVEKNALRHEAFQNRKVFQTRRKSY